MARSLVHPRKRRTRQHVIADLSVNYIERFIFEAGYTVERLHQDYGYDLQMTTYDERGYVEPGVVYFQLKAAEKLIESGREYVFSLDLRDYNLWLIDPMPVILVLFDTARRRGYWLDIQRYFQKEAARDPKAGAKTVRVRIPQKHTITTRTIHKFRGRKQEALSALGYITLRVIHG